MIVEKGYSYFDIVEEKRKRKRKRKRKKIMIEWIR